MVQHQPGGARSRKLTVAPSYSATTIDCTSGRSVFEPGRPMGSPNLTARALSSPGYLRPFLQTTSGVQRSRVFARPAPRGQFARATYGPRESATYSDRGLCGHPAPCSHGFSPWKLSFVPSCVIFAKVRRGPSRIRGKGRR